jgi:hypothetical protein
MTSAVGFTKPLLGRRGQLRATRTASPVVEYVEICKTAKWRLASVFSISLYVPNTTCRLIGSYWKTYRLRIYPQVLAPKHTPTEPPLLPHLLLRTMLLLCLLLACRPVPLPLPLHSGRHRIPSRTAHRALHRHHRHLVLWFSFSSSSSSTLPHCCMFSSNVSL